MISIVLLLKILGGLCFLASWVFMYRIVRRTERRLECLREHCDARITGLALSVRPGDEETDSGELAETRRRALEAERRFTEGIASILNFSCSSAGASAADILAADAAAAADSTTGKKGKQ